MSETVPQGEMLAPDQELDLTVEPLAPTRTTFEIVEGDGKFKTGLVRNKDGTGNNVIVCYKAIEAAGEIFAGWTATMWYVVDHPKTGVAKSGRQQLAAVFESAGVTSRRATDLVGKVISLEGLEQVGDDGRLNRRVRKPQATATAAAASSATPQSGGTGF